MADEPLSRVGKGDPITADWANAVADAINARGASDPNANGTATPYGVMTPADVDTMMRAPDAQAMPFDAAIIREGAEGDALYMALPASPDYVFYGADALSPSPAQTLGDAQNAWVRIEAVTNNTARYVSLAVTLPDSSTTPPAPPGWRLFVASSPTARPGWADPEKPVMLLAGYNIAADDTSGADAVETDTPSLLKGLVQYHRGTVNLGGGEQVPRPFKVRVGAEGWDVYLPPETAQAVRFRGVVIPPLVAIGTEAEPWMHYTAPASGEMYLVINFEKSSDAEGRTIYSAVGWTLAPSAEPTELLWPHIVAAIEPGRGLVQYHLGSLIVGDPDAPPAEPPEPPPICGNPLNGGSGGAPDYNPVNGGGGTQFPKNDSETGHPLDGKGEGGYTPTCADDLDIDPLAA